MDNLAIYLIREVSKFIRSRFECKWVFFGIEGMKGSWWLHQEGWI